MSHENVEIVRRVYEAVARRDSGSVLELYDPEFVSDISRLPEYALTGQTIIRGRDELRSSWREWYEVWESFEDDCEELIDAGEHVISVVTRRGRGRASGAETSKRVAGVWTIRNGRVVRTVWFPSVEEALEVMGLSEQDAQGDS
jgi:ketosteroid isomerase-like protein